jgi:peptide/nickel transport system substrate-binding protein
MKNLLVFSLIVFFFCFSCSNKSIQKVGEGGKMYGGTFNFMSQEKVTNLFPASSDDAYSQRVYIQLFETLLRLDYKSMEAIPGIAASYSISKDGKTYTFQIRKGIKFHADKCLNGKTRELIAADVKFSLDFTCSSHPLNKSAYIFASRIKGASEFYKKPYDINDKNGVKGIKVLGKHSLSIELNEPFSGLDIVLTHSNLSIFPKEALIEYGNSIQQHPIGTGPFQLNEIVENGITLVRNSSYWRKDEFGNQLPFLDGIHVSYMKEKRSELFAFRNKKTDIVLQIPVEEVENILGSLADAQAGKNVKHRVLSKSSLSIQYIAFDCQSNEFKNEAVRNAFNCAINRKEIVDNYLAGEGWATTKGFVPLLPNFPSEKVKGHVFNVVRAKQLMEKAGYNKKNPFPVLDFYVNGKKGSEVHLMCQGIADQLYKNIGVKLNIKLCSLEERQAAINSGKAKIWRSGWIADYPAAEDFLSLFYSGNVIKSNNDFGFKNSEFDQKYEQALKEKNEKIRSKLLIECDQLIIHQGAVMPILTNDFMVMLNARVRDFQLNSMENLDLSSVFIKEPRN